MSLEGALTHRTITTAGEQIRTPLDGEAAGQTRDAFAKALYAHAFVSLVKSVNEAIVPPPGEEAEEGGGEEGGEEGGKGAVTLVVTREYSPLQWLLQWALHWPLQARS